MPKIMPKSSSISSGDDGATSVMMTTATKRENTGISLHYPMLSKSNYTVWTIKMRVYLQAQGVWDAIEPGTEVETRKDKMALAAIYEAIPEDNLLLIAEKETAKEAWETLKTKHMGADRVRQARLQTLKSEFETLRMKEAETIDDFAEKLTAIVSKAAGLGGKFEESNVVKKFLLAVPNKFLPVVTSIEQFADLTKMTLEEAIGRLKTFEERIRDASGEEDAHLLLTKEEWMARWKDSSEDSSNMSKGHNKRVGYGRGRGRGYSNVRGEYLDGEHVEEKKKFDKTKVKCFNCGILGHYARECHKPREEQQDQVNLVRDYDDEPALL